jgi:hypothetical protein
MFSVTDERFTDELGSAAAGEDDVVVDDDEEEQPAAASAARATSEAARYLALRGAAIKDIIPLISARIIGFRDEVNRTRAGPQPALEGRLCRDAQLGQQPQA